MMDPMNRVNPDEVLPEDWRALQQEKAEAEAKAHALLDELAHAADAELRELERREQLAQERALSMKSARVPKQKPLPPPRRTTPRGGRR